MAKVTAPLLSFGASGQIGKTQVYADWRGINYVRQRVVPANPQTTAQNLTRNLWRALSDFWKFLPSAGQQPWNAYALGQPFTNRNAFMGQNVSNMRGETDLDAYVGSPGALGGYAAAGVTATNDAALDQLTVDFTYPDIPADWAVADIVAYAFGQQATAAALAPPLYLESDAAPATELTIAGLPHDQDNVVTAWMTFTRPDGKTAYGPSLTVVAAAT